MKNQNDLYILLKIDNVPSYISTVIKIEDVFCQNFDTSSVFDLVCVLVL
jgi:hypothetical protein